MRTLSNDVVHNLQMLIAHLMTSEHSRLEEMGRNAITPDLLSDYSNARFEREIMGALYRIDEDGLPPKVQNVTFYMYKPHEATRARLQESAAMADGEVGLIRAGSKYLYAHLMMDRLKAAGESVRQMLSVPHLDLNEIHDRAMMELLQARPQR